MEEATAPPQPSAGAALAAVVRAFQDYQSVGGCSDDRDTGECVCVASLGIWHGGGRSSSVAEERGFVCA